MELKIVSATLHKFITSVINLSCLELSAAFLLKLLSPSNQSFGTSLEVHLLSNSLIY